MTEDDQPLTDADYQSLLAFRTGLRKFLSWSETSAREAGLTPAQHQLLLAVRGHPGDQPPTIGDLADHLLLRHHSTVELIDRAEAAGLVARARDEGDGRIIRIRLTPDGQAGLSKLSSAHLNELRSLAPVLEHLGQSPQDAGFLNGRRAG
ncbi:MAG TPA: MarR family winged helix-turn-helix transcriptional regulator [Streptosporangiaceae bacterium]